MVIGLGAAAFWVSLAAVLIAGSWANTRREAIKQETLLRIIEKTGQLDEQQVKVLFPPPVLPPHWFAPPEPPDGRNILRVFGSIVLAIAAGLAILFTILFEFGTAAQHANAVVGFGATGIVACFGIGLFVASTFVRPPRPLDRGDREA